MTIAFVHSNKAFLPELDAYQRFFAGAGIRCETVPPEQLAQLDHQVAWHFMGVDKTPARPGIYRIHEYLSPSTPPFRRFKDLGKRWLNTRPDLRIFQNKYVQQCLGFTDNTPFCFRDMGIPAAWLAAPATPPAKTVDVIYTGDLSSQRKPERLLDVFAKGAMQGHSLLLLSREYERLQQQYSHYSNIIFKGPVPAEAVREYILQARFAINYIPDTAPFNHLTSTKLLEYAACGVPVISTNYAWIRDFQQQQGARFLLVSPDLSDLCWEYVKSFDYKMPDMSKWTWEEQIRQSGVLEYLPIIR